MKATEGLVWLKGDQEAAFRVDRADLVGWLNQLLPVILIVYDATVDCSYWLHMQGYFNALPNFDLFSAGPKVTVHLNAKQTLEPTTIRQFAALVAANAH